MRQRNLDPYNRVGDLQLLHAHENAEKSGKDIEQWLQTRDESFRARHLIPDHDDLLRLDRFEVFIRAREALISKRFKVLFSRGLT